MPRLFWLGHARRQCTTASLQQQCPFDWSSESHTVIVSTILCAQVWRATPCLACLCSYSSSSEERQSFSVWTAIRRTQAAGQHEVGRLQGPSVNKAHKRSWFDVCTDLLLWNLLKTLVPKITIVIITLFTCDSYLCEFLKIQWLRFTGAGLLILHTKNY